MSLPDKDEKPKPRKPKGRQGWRAKSRTGWPKATLAASIAELKARIASARARRIWVRRGGTAGGGRQASRAGSADLRAARAINPIFEKAKPDLFGTMAIEKVLLYMRGWEFRIAANVAASYLDERDLPPVARAELEQLRRQAGEGSPEPEPDARG